MEATYRFLEQVRQQSHGRYLGYWLYLALALSALLLGACGGGKGAGDFSRALELMPRDAEGAIFVDVKRLSAGRDLRPILRELEGQWDFEDQFDIELSDTTYLVFAEVDSDDIFILGGLEDKDALRDMLEDRDYDEDEVRGVEVWLNSGYNWEAVAFLKDGRVVVTEYESDMEDLIDRYSKKSRSFLDKTSPLLSKLPSGVILLVEPSCGFEGCNGAGVSVRNRDSSQLSLAAVFEFDSKEDAEDAIELLEEQLDESELYEDEDFNVNGSFIIFRGNIGINDYADQVDLDF